MKNRARTKFGTLLVMLILSVWITACGQAVMSAAQTPLAPNDSPPPTTAPTATNTPAPSETPPVPVESEPDPSTELNPETGLPPGDAERGYRIAASTFNCYGCHVYEGDTVAAPPFAADEKLPFILERGEQRIASPDYTGEATTSMAYFIESVFQPEVYLVPGEWPNEMSTVYRKIMTDQDLADIIAWVITLEQAAP